MGDTTAAAAKKLRQFLVDAKGSLLRAWVELLDENNDQIITEDEFSAGMTKLGYKGDNPFNFFDSIVGDSLPEITLDMLDTDLAKEWYRFRKFAVATFEDVGDLLHSCSEAAHRKSDLGKEGTCESPRRQQSLNPQLTRKEFCTGMVECGWPGTQELLERIFDALCDLEDHCLRDSNLKWFYPDLERFRRREDAKKKVLLSKRRTSIKPEAAVIAARQERQEHLQDFKTFLKKKYGNFVRAWRHLAEHDQMVISSMRFQKALSILGYKGSTDLWKELNSDNSDFITLDELDIVNAEALAHFKGWVDSNFGGARAAFKTLDARGKQRIERKEFVESARKRGCPRDSKHIFQLLDKQGDGKIELSDVTFLDKWKPQEYLQASANIQAVAEIKELVLQHGGSYVKGWRRVFDSGNDNRCDWTEFCKGCKKIGYTGDFAGAWKAFDNDFTGYITLREFDQTSEQMLVKFREWAYEEFGCVAKLYRIFDSNNSDSLSWKEFRNSCYFYGYWANPRDLFTSLDMAGQGFVTFGEIKFLDDWFLHSMAREELQQREYDRYAVTSKQNDRRSRCEDSSLASKASLKRPGTSPREQHRNMVIESSRLCAVARRKQALMQRGLMPALGVVQERPSSSRSPVRGYSTGAPHRLWLSPRGWGVIDHEEFGWSPTVRLARLSHAPSSKMPAMSPRPVSAVHETHPDQ